MTTAPAAVHPLVLPALPPGPGHLDLTPLLRADPMTGVVAVLLALVVAAVVTAAHAAVVQYRNGRR